MPEVTPGHYVVAVADATSARYADLRAEMTGSAMRTLEHDREAKGLPRTKPALLVVAVAPGEEEEAGRRIRAALDVARPSGASPAGAVRVFHEKFGLVARDEVQVDGIPDEERHRVLALLVEEFAELVCAMTGWEDPDALASQIRSRVVKYEAGAWDVDVAAIAREASDLLAIVYGLALNYGFDLDAAYAEVMRACMRKERGDDPMKPVVKPEGWAPPDVAKAIGMEARGGR